MRQEDWLEQAQRRREQQLFAAGWRKGNGWLRSEQLWVAPGGGVFPESEAVRVVQGGDGDASDPAQRDS